MDKNNDEIIIGINIPKEEKEKEKDKKHKSKKVNKKKGVAKKATSKEKKTKARIIGNNRIIRNRVIKKFIIFFLVIIAFILFLSSSVFNIKDIEVENNNLVSKNEIIALMQLGDNKNIFSVSKKNLEQRIKENAYIEKAIIKRSFPNKLLIDIQERKVKYMIQVGEAFIYINKQGYILDKSNERKDVPVLVGIITDVSKLNTGGRLDVEDLKKLDTVNRIYEKANINNLLPLITKIDISDIKNYTLYLDSEKKIVYLGDCSNLNTRILYVCKILEQESGKEGEIFVNVDLNDQYVYFREKI